ncbi:hypothetical protein ABMA70_02585 [Halobacteriovorax sp. XZX-3]|uniref:hypothetical protein n=1 Tax=unclassified Halobacteriovorax TaxID=2639665 RepID=UPI000CD11DB9|nr:hypothetical protein [Halobacteriovorax sp. DA5]POB14626.1 hypothetical protein C0Z22_05900 [Halobacteriovorax sp. DA5]
MKAQLGFYRRHLALGELVSFEGLLMLVTLISLFFFISLALLITIVLLDYIPYSPNVSIVLVVSLLVYQLRFTGDSRELFGDFLFPTKALKKWFERSFMICCLSLIISFFCLSMLRYFRYSSMNTQQLLSYFHMAKPVYAFVFIKHRPNDFLAYYDKGMPLDRDFRWLNDQVLIKAMVVNNRHELLAKFLSKKEGYNISSAQ